MHGHSYSAPPAPLSQRAAMPMASPAPMVLFSMGPAPSMMAAPDPVMLPEVVWPAGMQHVPAPVQPHAVPAHQAAAAQAPSMSLRSGQRQPGNNVEVSLPQRPPRGPRGSHAHASDLPATDQVPGAVSPKAADTDSSPLDPQWTVQQKATGKTSHRRRFANTAQDGSAGVPQRSQPGEKGSRPQKRSTRKTPQQDGRHASQEPPAGDANTSEPAAPDAKYRGAGRKAQRKRPSLQPASQREAPPGRSKTVTMQTDSPIRGVILPGGHGTASLLPRGDPIVSDGEGGHLQKPPPRDQNAAVNADDEVSQSRILSERPKAEDGASDGSAPHKKFSTDSTDTTVDDLASGPPGLSSSASPCDVRRVKDCSDTAGESRIGAWRPMEGAAEDAGTQAVRSNSARVVWQPVKQLPWVYLEKAPMNCSQTQQAEKHGCPDTAASACTAEQTPDHKPSQAKEDGDSGSGSTTSKVYIRAGACNAEIWIPYACACCSPPICPARLKRSLLTFRACQDASSFVTLVLQWIGGLVAAGSAHGLLPLHSKLSKYVTDSVYWLRVEGSPLRARHPHLDNPELAGPQELGTADSQADTHDRCYIPQCG